MIDVTVARLLEFRGTIDAICQQELGRLPSHTEGDPVGEIMLLMALQGQTGEQLTAWLHDQPEAVAYRTKPAHKDPADWTDAELLVIRGALNIKITAPYGPRPGQPDNMASTNAPWIYTPEQRKAIRDGYKARGYTHGPVGPFVDPGYHGQIPGVDIRQPGAADQIADLLQEFWDDGICPVVFIQVDGWTLGQMRTLEPVFRSDRWQRLCRVVCNGFEQQGSKYGWSNQDYINWLSWLRDVFPNAKRLLHTVDGIEAPVGNGDDTSKPGMSNGQCWSRVTPLIHGWLHQSSVLFPAGVNGALGPNHVDPNGDGRTDEAHWFDLWDASKPWSFTSRFRHGTAGWPTTSANGGPLKVYAGEYYSFALWWANASEDFARDHGQRAVQLGADGYFDGGR